MFLIPPIAATSHASREYRRQPAGSTFSFSCGVSRYDFCTPVLDAINNSDQAMYQAKSDGKNRCAAV